MNETWQEELTEDYENGLYTAQEVQDRIKDVRSEQSVVASYTERYANGADQEAA